MNKKTNAHAKAVAKYNANRYTSKTVRFDKEYYNETLSPKIKELNMSENSFIVKACRYIIDNDIDLTRSDSSEDN